MLSEVRGIDHGVGGGGGAGGLACMKKLEYCALATQ